MKKETSKYPSFSVLMSVYKKENPLFLDKALISLEQQTILPKEIVLVEDGILTSELEKIIINHKNQRAVKYIIVRSSKNNGLASALHLGTKYVSTKWIARMDSDDYSVKNRFEKQLNVINDDSDLAVIGGQINEFAHDIRNIVGNRIVPTTEHEIQKFIKWRNPFNHPTIMIRKDVLENVGGYLPFGNLEDYYLWARVISAKYRTINIPDILVHMRVDEGMYNRRGRIGNIKYFYRLRGYLRRKKIISPFEELIGDIMMTSNIIIPSLIRKLLYQKVLHNNMNRK